MRKRNHVESALRALDAKFAADHFLQFRTIDELRDSQPPDRNDETRSQDFARVIHPQRAVANLVRSRDPICAARILSGKTPADRCEINFRSNRGFIHPAKLFEPAKKCLTGGVRKWSSQNRFSRSGCLTNDHYVAHDCGAGDGRRFHSRAAPAAHELLHVSIELRLNSYCSHGPVGRSHIAEQRATPGRATDPWLHRSKTDQRRKIENSRLNRMLRMMQVTMGK